MITRTMDAAFLNEVANHPEVRPFLGGGLDPLDLTDKVRDPLNIALVTEDGGWLLQCMMPGVYELHTLFLPAGRGRSYFARAKEALRYVFTVTDALEILTKCPDDNAGARMAASLAGFRERFRRDGIWDSGGSDLVGISFQAFTVDDWIQRDSAIEAEGAAVLGAVEPGAENDLFLCRLIGATVLMVRGGQTAKAVGLFNRTAAFAGYAPIVALRDDLVDVRGAIVHVKADGVGVLCT